MVLHLELHLLSCPVRTLLTADFRLERAADRLRLVASGDWTDQGLGDLGARLDAALAKDTAVQIDLSGVGRLDTVGALVLARALGPYAKADRLIGRPETLRLVSLVLEARSALKEAPHRLPSPFRDMVERLGRGLYGVLDDVIATLTFNGHLLVAAGRALTQPQKIRWAACFSLIERAGLDALPIVAVTTFFIGAVLALLGANMLAKFGAQVFVVELIGIAVLREFNVIITSVLLAGRSASNFAAEIGAMKMSQEIDAMKVLGIDPFDALVLPRFFALLFAMPILTFVATLSGLLGGMLVTWVVLDLGPAFFFQRIVENVGATHFWIGMSKAPIMAGVIAAIGCRQGMEVGGDVESLGRRVTSAVVQSIFSIILIDALFALIYMRLDL
jgi:phospholipid/cholesterol/gamma-HCH transport system permease protein